MNMKQIRAMLQPKLKQARHENKLLFHPKVKDKKGNPKFVTPDELEADLDYSGSYAYPPEEWKLVNPDESPEVQKLVSETDEGHRERAVFDLINELKNKKS